VLFAIEQQSFDAAAHDFLGTSSSQLPTFGEPSAAVLMAQVLKCIYQRTNNSSEQTYKNASDLAASLGASFDHWDIDDVVSAYTAKVEKQLGRTLTWDSDDVTLQNIQARARVPALWMLANVEGRLLLATSNRSEISVGYTTMDGDTAGGLNPIGGIDKAFLIDWLRWIGTTGPDGHGPLTEALGLVGTPPTAELRPPSMQQTDEADLMPYARLERIELLAIEQRLDRKRVVEILSSENPTESIEVLQNQVQRFYTLWASSQWKRERYAPSFHVDTRNLDPRSWCRFPILSKDFGA
jgi:NAD+ synthase (glutamine-hydrolysing)